MQRMLIIGFIEKAWWYCCFQRNGHRIVAQYQEKDVDQSDWTTLDTISKIYDIIYDEMGDETIAEKMDRSVFMNQNGK